MVEYAVMLAVLAGVFLLGGRILAKSAVVVQSNAVSAQSHTVVCSTTTHDQLVTQMGGVAADDACK
jgi:hypothetical protein